MVSGGDDATGSGRATRRRRWVGWLGAPLVGLVILFASGVGARLWDATVVAPWAWPPGPFLTQGWVATAETPSGARAVLFIDVHRPNQGQGFLTSETGTPVVLGTGRFCSTAGADLALEVSGYANRSGDAVHISAIPVEAPTDGLVPTPLDGTWTGETLVLSSTLSVLRGGVAVASAELPDSVRPTTFAMVPGTAADAERACVGLG
jgi:hypothetical protein